MSDTQNLLFHVLYLEEEYSFQLSKYDTVGDLKNKIFQKFGLAPYKQIIECWHENPKTDGNTLITCCLSNDCNYLVVYNVEDNFPESSQSNPFFQGNFSEQYLSLGSNTEEYVPQYDETSSVLSFIQYFSSNFTNRGIIFNTCCLDDAFSQAFSIHPNRRRIVLLYFHNKNDPFASFFCKQLTKPNIQNILKETFFLLCWDIENKDYNSILIEALHKHVELRHFEHFVDLKICAALLIVPIQNSVTVISVMKGKLSEDGVLETLQNAQEMLRNENPPEEPNQSGNPRHDTRNENPTEEENHDQNQRHAIGSKEYQQLMLDLLGDRDYDSFDYYESDYLKDKIGYALYGPPQKETGYETEQKMIINSLFTVIVRENKLIAKWKDRIIISFIYVCMEPLPEERKKRAKKFPDYDPYSDTTPTPVFVLRKCKISENACRLFIDDKRRVYDSWEDYLSNNQLPKCKMVFPKNGRYEADSNGDVILDRKLSPACDLSTAILQGADIASAVGGIASGATMVAAAAIPAVAAAPLVVPAALITGLSAGAYSLGRSAYSLYDRKKHKENLSFFESPEARGAYINIVAGSLGFAGTGANLVVSRLAAQGFNIGRGATATVNALNIVNLGAGGAGVVNASYDVIRNWWKENEAPSLLTIVQLSSSILFFGHAVYNYRSFNTIIEESQTNTLREYQDSLRSNRQRKAFTKLVKETIRQNDGSIQRGQAEVISTIRNMKNGDEVFATLSRTNKAMNKNNVRFAAQDGKITLNGIAVDMTQFTNMEKTEVFTFLTKLPDMPKPSNADIKIMTTYIKNSFNGLPVSELAGLAISLVKLFGSTDQAIKEKIINSVALLIKTLVGDPAGYMTTLDQIFPNRDKYFRLITMVSGYFQRLVNEMEEKYAKWKETQDPDDEEPCFLGFLGLDDAQRIKKIFDIVTETYFFGTNLTQVGLEKLLEYFYTWLTCQVYSFQEKKDRRQRRIKHSRTPAPKVKCSECGGWYYVPPKE